MNISLKDKGRIKKALLLLIPSAIAIIIVSSTVGRELFEGRSQTLWSFSLIHFSGYLFFLLMPVELAFVYYLPYFDHVELIGMALATAVTAQIIDYLIGYSFSHAFICNLVGKKRIDKAEKYIRKYGNLTIFIFNLLPLSSPIIALAAGMLRFKFSHLMIYSFSGLLLKYIFLAIVF